MNKIVPQANLPNAVEGIVRFIVRTNITHTLEEINKLEYENSNS